MISLDSVQLRRGTKLLLDDSSLSIHPGQNIGVIGANGGGKTSFFKLLLGQLSCDAGNLYMPSDWRVAHMAQELATSERTTLDFVIDGDLELRETEQLIERGLASDDNNLLAQSYQRMDEISGFDAHYRAEQLLHGLGFHQSELNRPVSSFSGGWRIRLNLAQSLMSPSDLLLLDEPTNHLDLDATIWLEGWLRNYEGSLVVISHDRDFLDNVVDRIVHLEHKKTHSYKGNYSSFERLRSERLALQQASYEKQQRRRKDVESFVARFRYKASKAKQAQSRLKELERMEGIAPAHVDSPFYFKFSSPKKAYGALVNLSQASLGYQNSVVLENVNFDLQPGTRIGLLGPNGAGKSTLIRSLIGDLDLINGLRVLGENLTIGYFAQHQLEVLDLDVSPLLHIRRISPKATDQEIRNFLGGFNFHNDKALDPIENFSGGEKARFALALIVWQKPNLLLLDEPTNHLDLEMRHALTMALQTFDGALVVISHDRHLLRNTVDEFYLVANKTVEEFKGDLGDYQQWLKDFVRYSPIEDESVLTATTDKKANRKKAARDREKVAPITKKIRNLEGSMHTLEEQLQEIERQLSDQNLYIDDKKADLGSILSSQGDIKRQLKDIEEQWLNCQAELERIEV